MLYYLFQWLDKYDFPGAGMFGYTSFRALMAIILALLISSIWGDKFINLLKRKQITETQRDANIDPFGVNKVGVPSMGGVIIIFSILIPCLLLGKLNNIYMILMLITTVWLGSLGFADDYIKIFKKDKEGLHGKFKIIGQVGLGLIVGLTLYLSPQVVIRENIEVENPGQGIEVVHAAKEIKATQTTIPFFKSNNLDYADLVSFMGEHAQTAGWILFVFVTIFVVTAVSNGANLNDGMDGMAAGNSAIIGLTLGILAYVSSHIEYAGYLNIMYIPGSEELVIFICAFIGAMIGFLWYNAYPAQVFMGDTGSLTLGGIIAVCFRNFVNLGPSNGNIGLDMGLSIGSLAGSALISIIVIKARHWFHTPHQCITIPSVIPMVPGVLMYRALFAFIDMHGVVGEVTVGMNNLIKASLAIICIALGVAIPNVFFRRFIADNRKRKLLAMLVERKKKNGEFVDLHEVEIK